MELELDTYDVVVIGTGLAESIAAAYVIFALYDHTLNTTGLWRNPVNQSSTSTQMIIMVVNKLL